MLVELPTLEAECERCVGLCCVALPFAASADFAIDKPAGVACPHLRQDYRCEIHASLREQGFPGCAAFDCFGAGQHLSQTTFPGVDWRGSPEVAARLFAAFGAMRQLHQLLWLLREALTLDPAAAVHDRLRRALLDTRALTELDAESLLRTDVGAHHDRVNAVLRQASELARASVRPRGIDRAGAYLVGKDLTRLRLRGANLRGALLTGAVLRGVDLDRADVTGADLRGADLAGTNLATTLFLTQAQLASAHGDAATALPAARARPRHWGA